MSIRVLGAVVVMLLLNAVAYAKEDRWSGFAEDTDLRYYLDKKSVHPLPEGGFIFWIKSVPKDREYVRREYNLNNLSYILTNYEIDCTAASFRVRATVMFDKNRKELSKNLPTGGEAEFEPIPPESVVEIAQESFCAKATLNKSERAEPAAAALQPAPDATVPDTELAAPAVPGYEPTLR